MACRTFRSWLHVQAAKPEGYSFTTLARDVEQDVAEGCFTGMLTPARLHKHVMDVHLVRRGDERYARTFTATFAEAVKAWRECRL